MGTGFATKMLAGGVAAGEVAANLQSACRFCEHYDHQAALNTIHEYEFSGDANKQRQIQKFRHVLSSEDGPDEYEARNDAELFEHMGICHAMSDIKKEDVFVHVTGCCPKEIDLKTQTDLSKLFKMRDPRAAKIAGQIKTDVMRATGAKERLFFRGSDLESRPRAVSAAVNEKPSGA